MADLIIEGGIPLQGVVKPSGAKNSALKLIHAAMFSNDDIELENVPRIGLVLIDLAIIEALGAKFTWISDNKLILNGSGIQSYEVPYDLGSHSRTSILLAAPLLYRFGKAMLPIPRYFDGGLMPVNRWIDTWEALHIKAQNDSKYIYLEAEAAQSAHISFKKSTHMGTENAILSSLFVEGETIISNAAEESEIDDVIGLCNALGGNVERLEDRKIKIIGKNVFRGGSYKIQPDKTEIATFATAAVLTAGDITIQEVKKESLLAFTNMLSKLGVKYEFTKNDLRVWSNAGVLQPIKTKTAVAPGFLTDWQPLVTLLCTQAAGESSIYDTVFQDNFAYVSALNRMGTNITLCTPSDVGEDLVIAQDAYDLSKKGEPKAVAKIIGPTTLKNQELTLQDARSDMVLVLAALAAQGESTLSNYELLTSVYFHFYEKLTSLGAHLEVYE